MNVLPAIKEQREVQQNRAAPICTLAELIMVVSGTAFVCYWCPWMIVIPNWLIYVGYGLIAMSGFLAPNPKDRAWIFWVAFSAVLLRLILSINPDIFSDHLSDFEFVIKYVEPAVVLIVALTCLAGVLWHRFKRVA